MKSTKTPQEKTRAELASLRLQTEILQKQCATLSTQVVQLTAAFKALLACQKTSISETQYNDLMMRLTARDRRDSKVEKFLRAVNSDQKMTEAKLQEILTWLKNSRH